MIERRIKELAIALEALSRVNTYSANAAMDEVQKLLDKTTEEAKEQTPQIRPRTTTIDEEIPF